MSPKSIFIFIPDKLEKHKSGYLEGFFREHEDCYVFYITSPYVSKNCTDFIGYSGRLNKCQDKTNTLHFFGDGHQINGLTSKSVTKIYYDYDCFNISSVIENTEKVYGIFFSELKGHLSAKQDILRIQSSIFLQLIICLNTFFSKIHKFIGYSATFTSFCDSLRILEWCLEEKKRRRWSVALGNIIFAKLIDLTIGLLLVNYFLKNQQEIVEIIEMASQEIVKQLKSLLLYLMGSPIGLKLNYAFNKTLGTFFFYHITLWRIFLNGIYPLILRFFNYLIVPCLFGFTFQLAMLSDIIAICTFHVYCIYVYAARMFYLQIRSLVSLWRLLTGRKFNPLRNRVDSSEYEQNQLFIGTLAFTIFLFLLPTTTMYYTVFVTFRMLLKIVEAILGQLRYFLTIFPIFGVFLWMMNSRQVAGSLCLKWCKIDNDGSLHLKAELNKLRLGHVINLVPKIKTERISDLGKLVPNIFTGVLM